MTQYVTRPARSVVENPKDWARSDIRQGMTIVVIEEEPVSKAIGLVDHRGNQIFAVADAKKFGFIGRKS